MPAHNAISLVGQRFKSLVAIRRVGRHKKGHALWLCRCDCGKEVFVGSHHLRSGQRATCGKHAAVTVRYPSEYRTWCSMRQRCDNKNNHAYSHYGARGIKVCKRWRLFKNFIADMGRKPYSNYSIERKNNNGHYEPGNCIWLPRTEQNRNTRQSVFVTYQGRRVLLSDIAIKLGLNPQSVLQRHRRGETLEDTLSLVSLRKRNFTRRRLTSFPAGSTTTK